MSKQTIVVEQHPNHKYFEGAATEKNTASHVYLVVKTVNTLAPRINEWVLPSHLQILIDGGIQVTIKPSK